ncbi:MAG TPA: FMN-binding negative transcriptional regulator [Mycobacteriales bacterium]|jgi:transcriptional regulator|nr:FMN-binding negative transcriptional regulator [Mycobacteriales bacterium]
MFISRPDASLGEQEWRPFLIGQGFGHLIAAGRGRDVPVVSPTQYVVDDQHILLHLAAPNLLFEALTENPMTVLSVAGDWAYIPSAWKALADEDPALGIPTTYYAAVQVIGRAEVISDAAGILEILRRQLGVLQPDLPVVDPSVHTAKLPAIRGIRLPIEQVRAKFKYGGNVDVAHRAAVGELLTERGRPGDAAAREHLYRRMPPTR